MRSLAGTGLLVRLFLRLDRTRLSIWIVGVGSLSYLTAAAFADLYPTVESRRLLAGTLERTPAILALTGPGFDLLSIGGLVAWRIGAVGAVMVSLLGIFTVVRHTRAAEESGRLELMRSAALGRLAPIAAAFSVASGAFAAIGVLVTAGLMAVGEPAAGSIALGLGLASAGWSFAAIAAVTAQLTQSARTAGGLAGGILGVSFLLRAAGDSTPEVSFLSWYSPIGWTQQVRPFAGERWWVFGLVAGLVASGLILATAIASRRDLGDGLLAAGRGPGRAGPWLITPANFAWRLQRGASIGWVAGLAVAGMVFGMLADGIANLLEDNPQLADIVARLGGETNLTDAFFASVMGMVGLAGGAYVVQGLLRLRGEEISGRLEPVLATPVSRSRWLMSHVVVVLGGAVAVLAAAGIAAGLVHGLRTGSLIESLGSLAASALVQLPAVAVMAGITVALFGLLPRASAAAWAVLAAALVISELGPILGLGPTVLNLSPFTHVPDVGREGLAPVPLVALAGAAGALLLLGMLGFARRDAA